MSGTADVSRKPLVSACFIAILGMILVVVGLATGQWTVTDDVTIGLWTLIDESGASFSWTDTGAYKEEFFYASWFTAVRGLMMGGTILGGLGILFNLYVIGGKKYTFDYTKVLLCYYALAFSLVAVAASVYCCLIPQPVNISGHITSISEDIDHYIYLANYGYSMWLSLVGSGAFLLSTGMSYEGSNQLRVQDRLYGHTD